VAVRENCKHYILQTVSLGDRLERCKLSVNQELPFACPEDCLFYEKRTGVSRIGWQLPDPKTRKDDNPKDI